jgi:branched-chain amino acid transport system permease protein
MSDFLQLVFSGMATGSIYALAALGFTLLWQASGTVNFAQGEFVMLPAFAMLAFSAWGAPLPVAFVLTCGAGRRRAGLGLQARHRRPAAAVRADAHRGGDHRPGHRGAQRRARRLQRRGASVPQPVHRHAVRRRRRHGVAGRRGHAGGGARARAGHPGLPAEDRHRPRDAGGGAEHRQRHVLGIDVPRMVFYTFAINAVLACAAALLVTPTYLAKFDMGESLGTKAFFAAIIGGFNNSSGALLGGIIVGVFENLAAAYISPAYKDAVALVLFMAVILFKPQGLLGRKVERKV